MIRVFISIIFLMQTYGVYATNVRFETNVGDIDIELFDEQAPITVQNFLNYVNDGDYDNTVIHRSIPGFVIQGGGFRYTGSSSFQTLANDPAIVNESGISNTLGTISMARQVDPNSATSQWFFNLNDNSNDLDEDDDNDGYAVFGKVSPRGLEVIKLIESFLRINFSSSNLGQVTSTFPIYGFFSGTAVTLDNTVKITKAYVLSETFQVNAGISGTWYNPDTNGQGFFFEVLPNSKNLALGWYTFDTELPDAEVPSTIGAAGNRWLTAVGGFDENEFAAALIKTSGGVFDDPKVTSLTEIGEVMITFNDCKTGVLSYSFTDSGLTNTINIERISGENVELCEQLAVEANQGVSTQ